MADDPRQPIAIRVTRPYATEDEFLEREIETLTRTSAVLVGAQSRPQGVILRFEVTLANGAPLLRGEGRVVGFKARAFGDLPGLTLRFTRLDVKSKALVDRAAAIRDARSRAMLEAAMGETDSLAPPARAASVLPAAPPASIPPPAPPPSPPRASGPPAVAPDPSPANRAASARAPASRDSLLERLRTRRRSLTDDAVTAILAKRVRK